MKKLLVQSDRPGILPTVYGLAFFAIIVDIFALGFFRNAGPYHTVGLTLIVLGMVAMIQTNSNIDSVTVDSIQVEPGEEGATTVLRLVLRNNGTEPRFNLSILPEKKYKCTELAFITELYSNTNVELLIQCPSRGIHDLGRIRIQSRAFYGLFSAWKTIHSRTKLIVYPKPEGSLPLPDPDAGGNLLFMAGEDFTGHRKYQAGASLKQVDWKAYARGQAMLLKEFGSHGQGPIHLQFDAIPGHDAEQRLRQMSAWIFACTAQNRAFSLSLNKKFLPEGQGIEQLHAALVYLAGYKVGL